MRAEHKFYEYGYEHKRSHTKVTWVQVWIQVQDETLCGYDDTASALWYGYEYNKYEVTYTRDMGTGTVTKSDDVWSSYTTSGTSLIQSGREHLPKDGCMVQGCWERVGWMGSCER
jgi:hypothetical protein